MPVVTVSGNLGSGAREVAQAVAVRLGLDYVDQEIMVEAARRLGVSVSAVESHDERPSRLGERLASIMRTLMERSAMAGTADPMTGGGGSGLDMILSQTYGEAAGLPSDAPRGQLDDESYLRTLTSIIQGIAARGNVVILGRGQPGDPARRAGDRARVRVGAERAADRGPGGARRRGARSTQRAA